MRMLLAGGGTGGHLFPAVALAEELLSETPNAQVLFVGTSRGIESRVIPQKDWPLRTIDIAGFVGTGWRRQIRVIPKLGRSLLQSLQILREFQPQVVVGVGGYASGPLLAAARLKGYPILIHEQNAQPGLTNRLLGRWVDRICISFPRSAKKFPAASTVFTGNPVRRSIRDCQPLPNGAPHLLVFGGSRGARAINEAVVAALPHLETLRGRLTIEHQTGDEDLEPVREGYRKAGWDPEGVIPFIDDMSAAYTKAHLVICRAGATTVAELAACGRPALMIPYPHAAGDHQSANAAALARRGAALQMPQSDLTPEKLGRLLREVLLDRDLLVSMAGAAHALGRGDAAAAILKECRAIARPE